MQYSVPAIGPYVFFTVAKKPRSDTVVGKGCVVKVSQHGIGARQLHGEIVVGTLPQIKFLGVAALAGTGACKGGCGGGE